MGGDSIKAVVDGRGREVGELTVARFQRRVGAVDCLYQLRQCKQCFWPVRKRPIDVQDASARLSGYRQSRSGCFGDGGIVLIQYGNAGHGETSKRRSL